jgi:hypothetical protein
MVDVFLDKALNRASLAERVVVSAGLSSPCGVATLGAELARDRDVSSESERIAASALCGAVSHDVLGVDGNSTEGVMGSKGGSGCVLMGRMLGDAKRMVEALMVAATGASEEREATGVGVKADGREASRLALKFSW